jgi:putative addiction module component (TIGR02574 family)
VGDIWETVAAVPDAIALSGPQKRELDRRLETYRRNPGAAIPWKDVLSELRRKG